MLLQWCWCLLLFQEEAEQGTEEGDTLAPFWHPPPLDSAWASCPAHLSILKFLLLLFHCLHGVFCLHPSTLCSSVTFVCAGVDFSLEVNSFIWLV